MTNRVSAAPLAAPVDKKILTPGVYVLMGLTVIGLAFAAARFLFGIGSVSNLNDQYPWGIWIGVDIATGIALTAGGFTTAGLVYAFRREHFRELFRPALLTALLGYIFEVLALLVDIGRYWNLWSPMVYWNPGSWLFVLAIVTMFYLTILFVEFLPIVVERFKGKMALPGALAGLNKPIETFFELADRRLGKILALLILAGIVLSCLHQTSLGALMLIAPTKVHPLWYTPALPFLFLLSAIAAGFPMVVFESIISAKTFHREPEMHILTPLSAYIPVMIGVYLAAKLGDMIYRDTFAYLFDGSVQAKAFWVEMVFGVIAPFLLMLSGKVRRSAGWLFFACTLFVLGVFVNRINVFVVAYTPVYKVQAYFPAVGELAITIGMIAALILCYRVIVTIFPVLGAEHKKHAAKAVMLLAVAGIGLAWSGPAQAEDVVRRPLPVIQTAKPSIHDAKPFRWIDSPVIRELADDYGPVRFLHRKHAQLVQDCTVCHHRQPREEGEKYGDPSSMDLLRKAGALPAGCSSCHEKPWDPKALHKPGLKGAFHQMCLDCHLDTARNQALVQSSMYRASVEGYRPEVTISRTPVDCRSCHAKNKTDHAKIVEIKGPVKPEEVTRNCLSCHEKEGREFLKSMHWQWAGPSPFAAGQEKRNDLGKRSETINNTTLALAGNWPACTRCHPGYGWRDEKFDFTDPKRIDCLVCHDTTGKYKKAAGNAGLPADGLDLVQIAKSVSRPSAATCGNCHVSPGPDDKLAHGGMSPVLARANRDQDVHMSTQDAKMVCQDCHATSRHLMAGRGVGVPVSEGRLDCALCHTETPHVNNLLGDHLNRHGQHLACQTCHLPVFAKDNPALAAWDWSLAGKEDKTADVSADYGRQEWAKNIKPAYRWFNGKTKFYFQGDPTSKTGLTELNQPMGRMADPESKIFPFQAIKGMQPRDAELGHLLTPKMNGEFWSRHDWDQAVKAGAKTTGAPYSGRMDFAPTIRYKSLNHEVMPKEQALRCAECHVSLAQEPSCGKCHIPQPDVDFGALAKGEKPDTLKRGGTAGTFKEPYLDFQALGYGGDPVEKGGRFRNLPLSTQLPPVPAPAPAPVPAMTTGVPAALTPPGVPETPAKPVQPGETGVKAVPTPAVPDETAKPAPPADGGGATKPEEKAN